MPKKLLRMVEPVVRHGMKELAEGVPIEHTLREVALMSALVGSGVAPAEAIAIVEEREEELLGTPSREWRERTWAPGGFGKPMGGSMPWGCPTGHGWRSHGWAPHGGWAPWMNNGAQPWDWMPMSTTPWMG